MERSRYERVKAKLLAKAHGEANDHIIVLKALDIGSDDLVEFLEGVSCKVEPQLRTERVDAHLKITLPLGSYEHPFPMAGALHPEYRIDLPGGTFLVRKDIRRYDNIVLVMFTEDEWVKHVQRRTANISSGTQSTSHPSQDNCC